MAGLAIYVPTCESYRHRENLCRKVWVPEAESLGIPVHFYDEGEKFPIYPSAPYRHKERMAIALGFNLAEKIKRMFKDAILRGYEHVLRVDTDTMIWPKRILEAYKSDWIKHDYTGNCCFAPIAEPHNFHYVSGMAYCLSYLAMSLVCVASVTFQCNGNEYHDEWAEDRFVGRIMHVNNVPIHIDKRIVFNEPWSDDKWLAWHDFGKRIGQAKGCPYIATGEKIGELY